MDYLDTYTKTKRVKVLAFDVDGVFSKQDVIYTGEYNDIRVFCIKDGSACQLAMFKGIPIALISGRTSTSVISRAKSIGIQDLYLGKINKKSALDEICSKYSIGYEDVLYAGDDFYDLPILEMVGFPCTVADADQSVKDVSIYCSPRNGGEGAVADIIQLIINAQFGKSAYREFAYRVWEAHE